MKKLIFICLILALILNLQILAITGKEILQKVDNRTIGEQAPKDLEAIMIMTIVSSKGRKKIREIKVWTKNNIDRDDWRVMKFLSPPDVKNVGFLVLSDDQMYLYLPEFYRIRRIASHNKKESFMGSDFSYEDMGTSGFTKFYDSKLLNENDNEWILELKRKQGVSKPYRKIKMWVLKESELPLRMELYDNSENLWKVVEQKVKKTGNYWIPIKIKMKNVKKNSYTVLEMKDIKVDQRLGKELFTKRFLKRRVK
jgi:outer membrane lipoprotein-sorting protein